MSNYRRAITQGGCYFFTAVTYRRREFFAVKENIDRLREGFRRVMKKHPFEIDAIAILPDHIHAVWQLPEGDSNYSMRWIWNE